VFDIFGQDMTKNFIFLQPDVENLLIYVLEIIMWSNWQKNLNHHFKKSGNIYTNVDRYEFNPQVY
jgi:hypothetical protein